jgi:transposase
MLSDSNAPSQAPTPVAAPRQSAVAAVSAVPTDLPRFGVGIDTSRYGHYAAFLRDDLQPAADELSFAESADGYAQLRARFELVARRCGPCRFHVRLDAAGQYADNLLHFLHRLSAEGSLSITLSCGDPQRNKNYRAAIFGTQKSDPVEARAMARFAVAERPAATAPLPHALRLLRQVAGRLQAVVRQRTRLVNQLHHLLALVFPELALLVNDIAAGWVLELVQRYPTATLLAKATEADLDTVPYLPAKHRRALLRFAGSSVASLDGTGVEELVRDQVRQVRDIGARQKRLEKLLVDAYRAQPVDNRLATIPGIGDVTAAVLTAFVLDIDRFRSPGQLVKYFGVLPTEVASGVDRDGSPRGPKRFVMSPRGNDLVRRYLWMAALSAVRFNPAVRALYVRVVQKHPHHKSIAIGHAMRKLLHLAYAVWKTGRPFDPNHYPWQTPAHVAVDESSSDTGPSPKREVEGRRQAVVPEAASEQPPARISTEATNDSPRGSAREAPERGCFVDFAHLKRQLSMTRVLDHLGLSSRLRGSGPQRRGACPLHRGDARGRTFSVHLEEHVFQCFDPKCAAKGDVIDLWSKLHRMPLRDAALDLVQTFHLEPSPSASGPEKRNG